MAIEHKHRCMPRPTRAPGPCARCLPSLELRVLLLMLSPPAYSGRLTRRWRRRWRWPRRLLDLGSLLALSSVARQ